jgi:hypothetical protein
MVIAAVGTAAGAWYIPLDEIVPIAALPPTTPFTAQETAAPAEAPVMVNCWVPVVERLTDEACIDNCAECEEVTDAAWPPPQPPHVRLKKVIRSSAKQLIAGFFSCTDCASASPSDVGMRIGIIQGRYMFYLRYFDTNTWPHASFSFRQLASKSQRPLDRWATELLDDCVIQLRE